MAKAIVRAGPQTASLTQAASVQDLVDYLGEAIGNPVTLEDTSFQLLAYSRHTGPADKARKQTILRRSVPESIVKALHESGMMNQLNDSPYPIRLPGVARVGLGSRVAMPIRVGRGVRGYLWIQETGRKLTDRDLKVLARVAGLIGRQLAQGFRDARSRQRAEGEFLRYLLLSPSTDPSHLRRVAEDRGVDLPAHYLVLTAILTDLTSGSLADEPFGEQGRWETLTSEITDFLNTAASRLGLLALWTSNKDEIVALIGSRDDIGVGELLPFVRRVATHARTVSDSERLHLSLGVSALKNTLTDVKDAYEEACRCLKAGQVLGTQADVPSPDSIGVLQFLTHLAASYPNSLSRHGIHAQFRKLVELHQRDSFSFPILDTIEAFLDCAGNVVKAAKRLGIHPNSLNYRLRRVSDAAQLDFSDGIQRLAVHAELKIWRIRS